MDETIPVPKRPIDKPFMMSVDSTFTIAGRGTVVTGTVEQGKAKIGDEIEIVGYSDKTTKTIITGKYIHSLFIFQVLKLSKKHLITEKLEIMSDFC